MTNPTPEPTSKSKSTDLPTEPTSADAVSVDPVVAAAEPESIVASPRPLLESGAEDAEPMDAEPGEVAEVAPVEPTTEAPVGPAIEPTPQPPLTLLYNWRGRATWLGVAAAIVVVYALFTRSGSGLFLLLFVVIMGGVLALNIWLQSRAYLEILGYEAKVRRFLGFHTIDGRKVTHVKEVINGRSPDVMLVTSDKKRYVVPSSRLHKGHSALFDWLAVVAPNAEYDKGALKILNILDRERGM